MADRSDLITALHEVPPALAAMMEKTFGTVTSVTPPDNVEDALKVQGVVAANFNNAILMPLSGLPIIELALRIGQNNPAVQAMLLSMLKVSGSLGKDAFTVTIQDGGSYPVGALPITVSVSGGVAGAESGALSGPENIEFEFDKGGAGKDWTAHPEIATAGEYTLDIAVEFPSASEPKTQTFHLTITDAPSAPSGGE